MALFDKRELGQRMFQAGVEPGGRRVNPETIVTRQVRELLRIMRVPHYKNWGGPMGEKGVSDIIGVLPPSGRAFFCELKAGRGKPTPEQEAFIERMSSAGALAFVAWGPDDLLRELRAAGYEPAFRISLHGEQAPKPPAPGTGGPNA